MSKSFNLTRLEKLVRWTLVTDRVYNIKTLWMYVTMMSIFFQMPNLFYAMYHHTHDAYDLIKIVIIVMPISILAAGGSYFFYSFYMWKDGIRELIMLPASKAEKFTVRFLLPILLQFVFLAIGLVIADILQHLVGFIINREPLDWMLVHMFREVSFNNFTGYTPLSVAVLLFWCNTMFLLGANLFRNIKFNFIITSVVLLVLLIIFITLLPSDNVQKGMIFRKILDFNGIITSIILLALSIFNIWLSYLLFGHRPLIGKYINKL